MVRMPTVPPFRSSTLANFFCVMMKWLSLPEFAAIMRSGPPRSTFWMMPSTDDSTKLQVALGQAGGLAFAAADEADVGVQSLVGEIAVLDRDEHRLREEGAVDQADLDGLARAVLRLARRQRCNQQDCRPAEKSHDRSRRRRRHRWPRRHGHRSNSATRRFHALTRLAICGAQPVRYHRANWNSASRASAISVLQTSSRSSAKRGQAASRACADAAGPPARPCGRCSAGPSARTRGRPSAPPLRWNA